MGAMETGLKPTILVVDDTPENLSLVSNFLKSDYRVRVATSGEKGLKIAISDTPPDLILLDVMMPVMDGFEVCQALRSNPVTCRIPVIFLSGKSEVEDENRGLSLGASDFITKPVSPLLLLARLKAHLAASKYESLMRDQQAFLEAEVAKRVREVCKQMGMAAPSTPAA